MSSTEQAKMPVQQSGSAHARQVPVGPDEAWDGQDLKRAFEAAAVWLTRNAEALNALNVFPVPDGDTGTNMALTMQGALRQVADVASISASDIAAGVSRGALMGARGNSGVILSQILRGFAEGIAGHDRITAAQFAEGLSAATATAYRAVLKPVEGTILTVMKDSAAGAQVAAGKENSFRYVLPETVRASRESVARTPTLLDKLRDAGVVDAGGQGLFVFLDGVRRFAEGEALESATVEEAGTPAPVVEVGQVHVEHGEYGYCTNFLLTGGGWDFDEVRDYIAGLGESAVIVGDDSVVKVHIHAENPGVVLAYACNLGSLLQISIANMQEQHEEFLQMHEAGGASAHTELAGHGAGTATMPAAPATGTAVIAVASGKGLMDVFKSMGATAIAEGGQTMNPSTEELLALIEKVPQNEVILLPNNGNIIMAARQTQHLTNKQVAVVPTDTIPKGIAALIAMNFEASLEDNARAMEAAAKSVETGEVTRAVRDAKVQGIQVKAQDYIGLHNNVLVTTGPDRDQVAFDLLERMGAGERELISLYYGGDLSKEDATAFLEQVQERYPDAEVELVSGGQPFYDYIISAE